MEWYTVIYSNSYCCYGDCYYGNYCAGGHLPSRISFSFCCFIVSNRAACEKREERSRHWWLRRKISYWINPASFTTALCGMKTTWLAANEWTRLWSQYKHGKNCHENLVQKKPLLGLACETRGWHNINRGLSNHAPFSQGSTNRSSSGQCTHQFVVVQTLHIVFSLRLAYIHGRGACLGQASDKVPPERVAATPPTSSTVTWNHCVCLRVTRG